MKISHIHSIGEDGHFGFWLTVEGITIKGMIYRPKTGAVLAPITKRSGRKFVAVRIHPSRIPLLRTKIQTAINNLQTL